MAGKKKTAKKRDPNQLEAKGKPGEDWEVSKARTVLQPTVQAASTLKEYGRPFGELHIKGLVETLTEQTEAANNGDLGRAEAMMAAQAHTLDAIFNNLATKAINAEYVKNLDIYLKLALRAQSQSRATWEALVAIKYPPLMGYVKQANIAHGPQQVNNTPYARENQNPKNKQLEQKDGERLDTGTTGTAGKADPAMATVGEIDGTED